MQAAVLSDGDTTPIRAGETLNLYSVYRPKDVTAPVFGIKERNFTLVTLEIQIVVHG